MSPNYLTTEEMARELRVSVTKLKEMMSTGHVPSSAYFQHGRTYRFDSDRVHEALLSKAEAEAQMKLPFNENGDNNG